MELRGARILVTRPKDQAGTLARLIEAVGGIALCAPMIRILEPESWDACDAAIAHLHEFSGIVFSSTNGVEFFLRRLGDRGIDYGVLRPLTILAVGSKTATALRKAGVEPSFVPPTFSGAALVSHFPDSDLHGRRFLMPRGNLGREESAEGLRDAGATTVPIVVYRTAGPDDVAAAFVRTGIASRSFDVVTFTSPSAAVHFVQILDPDLLARVKRETVVAVIGATTAEAVRAAGLPIAVVARTATVEGLVESLAQWNPSLQQPSRCEP